MDPTFRFVHAGDLHLELPPGGLAEIPDHLRSALGDAPYRAAERVFDAAIKHRADFVLLAGDIVQPRAAGPRAIVFLNDQFRKLRDADIRVYWAGSPSDDFSVWADAWPLPDNVHRFSTERVERIIHQRAGEPLLQIFGTSGDHPARIQSTPFAAESELVAVAVAHGSVDSESLARGSIAYWALGGEHARRSLLGGTVTAHYCGTPQGRGTEEAGPHGCTLVQVDETRRVRTTFLPTDAVRYCEERLTVDPAATIETLLTQINERVAELLIDPFGPELLIHWTISGSDRLANELRGGKGAELTARLRTEHGTKHPAAWTHLLEPRAVSVSAELYEEETLLGEFLRSARHAIEHPEETLNLESFLSERHLAGSLGPLGILAQGDTRKRVLTEVAALGVELLSPAEDRS